MESKGFKAGKIKASPNLAAALERLTMLASMSPPGAGGWTSTAA